MKQTRYWVNIVSLDHATKSVGAGFLQADKAGLEGLKELSKGDCVAIYSPRTRFRKGKPLQEFTALGVIADYEPYQTTKPPAWVCSVRYLDTKPAAILPLVPELTFLPDKEEWALPFKKGLFEIEEADFQRIAKAMGDPEIPSLETTHHDERIASRKKQLMARRDKE